MRKLPSTLKYGRWLALLAAGGCGSRGSGDVWTGSNDDGGGSVEVGEGGAAAPEAGPGPSLLLGGADAGGDAAPPAAEAGAPAAPQDASGEASASPGVDATAQSGSATDSDADLGDGATSVTDANSLWVDSRAAYCAGSGPPITIGDTVNHSTLCTGALAELSFSHALCSCTDASVQGYFKTDSFNSNVGSYQPGQTGAAVGVDDTFSVAGVPDIGGTLSVGGSSGWTLGGAGSVAGDLDVAGNLTLAGTSSVGRDVWVEGNVTSAGILQVGRDLHQTPGNFVVGIVGIGGSTYVAPFTLPEPCACAPDELLDIGGIVAQGEALNDDAAIGLSPSAFDADIGVADVTLPCGRFYLDQIAGIGDVTFHVPGRTALFVGGDIASAGVLSFDVGPQGELDVFVAGNLVPTGVTTFGNIARPAATRIYVGGSHDILLTGAGEFVGNIYAPHATVIPTGYSDFYGSIFAGDFEAPGALFIHYDRAVLDAGGECPPPLPPAAPGDGGPSPAGPGSPATDSGPPPAFDSGSAATVPDAQTPEADAEPAPAPDAAASTPDAMASPAPPPPACQVCGTCTAGTACVSNGCGACTMDSDCCSPLVCVIVSGTGSCQPLLQ